MIIVNVGLGYLFIGLGLLTPHVGLLYVLGLLFGPYGALGAVSANIILDLIYGFTPIEIVPSEIISFGISILAYKLWYSGFKADKITKPKLDSVYHLKLFLSTILICGLIYSAFHAILIGIFISPRLDEFEFISYFLNFTNIAFIFGIVSIWISNKIDFVEIPKPSKRHVNKRLYTILFCLLMLVSIIFSIFLLLDIGEKFAIAESILIGILLFAYLTKPFEYEIDTRDENTLIEGIIRNFLILTLAIAILGVVISILSNNFIDSLPNMNLYLLIMPMLIISDVIIILFLVPGLVILEYLQKKVVKPISSFSEIEKFIIIKHNNNYIENIREIEGEKERISAELDIARKIQLANLPTKALADDDFIVNGYSHPAKEVGGDFFDYYMIDEDNLAIVIGDVSGKGVPAAILSMISQVMIKHILNEERDPSKALYTLNNQLCEKNSETMFLTLWLGIYNETNKILTFSNAGHNPPLIKENGTFKYMDIDANLVLGIMENFEYVKEEIKLDEELVLYTDGITDGNNKDNEIYGEDRLLNFFNGFKSDEDPITPLLNDIHDFTKEQEQFDDMTLIYLKVKHD